MVNKYEKYIHTFNLNGGAAWFKSDSGLYKVDYIYNEPFYKIWIANVVLYLMWLKDKLL